MEPTAVTHHRVILEAGPATIRRLCCGTVGVSDDGTAEIVSGALDAIDDPVALVGGQPVAVGPLWRTALRSLACGDGGELVVVHPSWWSSARVGVVAEAAEAVAGDVVTRTRSWLLGQASDREEAMVVEIAQRLVAITGAQDGGVVAIPRSAEPPTVLAEVARAIAGLGHPSVVVLDAPGAVPGAPALAGSLARTLRAAGRTVVDIGDAGLAVLARSALSVPDAPSQPRPGTGRARPRAWLAAAGAGAAGALTVLPLAISAVAASGRHGGSPPAAVQTVPVMPTTFLVEGRVALTVPADWPAQRVITGPGSARVQVTSPSDPEVALHITQSPVAGETLSDTAEGLRRAIGAEPSGVFVDFNPSATSAGRPAVTYREVRAAHQVRWTVLLDGPVRISVGCQSRPDDEEAVRAVCEQAVRTAHAIG